MWKAIAYGTTVSLACTNVSAASVRVDLKWTTVEVEISPRNETHRSSAGSDFILDGRKITILSGGNGTQYKTIGNLGESLEQINKYGRSLVSSYKFQNNLITETIKSDCYTIKSVIKTDGENCNAVTTYHRLSGQKYFVCTRASNNEKMLNSDVYAENESCKITKSSSSQ